MESTNGRGAYNAILPLVCVLSATAGTGNTDERTITQAGQQAAPSVEWLAPPLPSPQPQTEAQKERGRHQGRVVPTPELLQPTLDPALPPYVPRSGVTLSGTFKGAASDVLPALVQLWVERFNGYHPGVSITIAPPYAGSLGAKELVKETLDFAFVSRELKPDDVSEFKAKFGYEPLSVPISGGSYRHYGFLDAIGVFVHKDNPLERITFDQLDAIYSSTRHRGGAAITTWGQLGLAGEWADKSVHAYGIKPWNGFEEFVRQRVLSRDGNRGEWRTDVRFDPVVFPVASRVAGDRYGLGYSGMAYIDAPVRMLQVGETAEGPFHAPTYEDVARAEYPLSRLIFFNTNRAPDRPLPPALDEFLRFILSREGQQAVRDHAIYLPLRGFQVQRSRALID